MLGIVGVFCHDIFNDLVMIGVKHMLFKVDFEAPLSLSYVGHSIGARDLIDSRA